jgi:hypothetical protein
MKNFVVLTTAAALAVAPVFSQEGAMNLRDLNMTSHRTFFGQYGDERVTEDGRHSDADLEAALRNAAE